MVERQEQRQQIIKNIEISENKDRVAESLKQVEIYNDRIYQHVYEYLRKFFSKDSVDEMPIVASINLARRVVKQQASLYKEAPKRSWTDLSDEQTEVVERIYRDMKFDAKMMLSNESFKLQSQNHVMIVPKNGKLMMRVLRNHHLDSIPEPMMPEMAIGYVLSTMDKYILLEDYKNDAGGTNYKGNFETYSSNKSNRNNEKIGDPDDYNESKLYIFWTKDRHFMTDKSGVILDDETLQPIPQDQVDEMTLSPLAEDEIIPIVDISIEKDFEYWVRQGESLSDFTVEYNYNLSSLSQVVQMQGFAQAFLKAPQEVLDAMDKVQIGPNYIMRLPISGDGTSTEFGFTSPNSDLSGSMDFVEMLLANYLSSRGIDPKAVSGNAEANHFSSGVERLLAMLDKFEASREDMNLYLEAEQKLWEIIKSYHNRLRDTDQLDEKYKTTELPEDSRVILEYVEPQMIVSKKEKLENGAMEVEAGFNSMKRALMEYHGIEAQDAEELMEEIEVEQFGDQQTRVNEDSEVEPDGTEGREEN